MFTEEMAQLVDMTDADLHARIGDLELERRRLDGEMAAALAVAEGRQLNAAIDGHRTMRSYLRAELNYSTAEADRWLAIAKTVGVHPGVGEAWMAGRIGVAQAISFARTYANRRVRDRLGAFVPILLDHAEHLPHPDFVACVDEFVKRADVDGAHDGRDHAIANRRASVVEVGATLHVAAFGGDGVLAAEMIAIHQRFAEIEFQNDAEAHRGHSGEADDGDLPRTSAQRKFDALVEIFRRASQSEAAGRATEPIVNIVVDAETFGRMQADAGLAPTSVDGQRVDPFTGLVEPTQLIDDMLGDPAGLEHRRCETSTGIKLHAHDVLRAALAGHVRRVVVDAAGVVTDLGRKSRLGRRAANGRTYTVRGDGTIVLPVGARRPDLVDESCGEYDPWDDPDEWERSAHLARQRLAAAVNRQV